MTSRISTLNPIPRSCHILYFKSVLYSSTIVTRFLLFFFSPSLFGVVILRATKHTFKSSFYKISPPFPSVFNKPGILMSYSGICLSRPSWIITLSLYKSGYGISTEPAPHKFIAIELVWTVIHEFAFTQLERIIHKF